MERWKEVPNTNGKILISDKGRVRSLLRDDRILKTQKDRKGYPRVRITINRKKRAYRVHRLVASAFIPNPENKPQVNHIDGNKNNNCVGNLEWCDGRENCRHAIDNGLWESVFRGSMIENEKRKRPVIATNILTGEVKRFASVSDAQRFVGSRHVTDVLKGKRKKAMGYTFEYAEGGDASCRS